MSNLYVIDIVGKRQAAAFHEKLVRCYYFGEDDTGLKASMDLGIKSLDVFGDSALVISQIKGEWDTKHPNPIPYKEHVLTLLPHFEQTTFEHFPREENQLADALATMSSMFKLNWDNEAPQITIERLSEC